MPRPRIPENVRWQIIGMHGAEMSCRSIGVNLDINYTVISRLVRKHADTGHVKDCSRQGRPLKTTPRADRGCLADAPLWPWLYSYGCTGEQAYEYPTAPSGGDYRLLVWRRNNRSDDCSSLIDTNRPVWCGARCNLNLRTWLRIHWSDESQYFYTWPKAI